MMHLISIAFLVVCYLSTIHAFGFGVNRLKDSHSSFDDRMRRWKSGGNNDRRRNDLHLGAAKAASCGPVKSFFYRGGVIDNFASIDDQLPWEGSQRYWVNEELWGGPGYPIFVFIGGEWTESCSTLLSGNMYMYNLAQEHHGLLVDVEHRFYGGSFPINNTEIDSLEFLTSDQALADLARLLEYVKDQYQTNSSKVITIGGSYSGNLAAWFRLKYPTSTLGSIASSGPLTAELNFDEYMQVVKDSIDYYGTAACNQALENAAVYTYSLVQQGPGSIGFKILSDNFTTCSPLQTIDDATILLSNLMGNVQGTVQYNLGHNNPTTNDISDMCNIMLSSNDHYANFVNWSSSFYNDTCEDTVWDDTIAFLANSTLESADGARQWTYQTCNQFGYYQTTDYVNQPFNSWKLLDLNFYNRLCEGAFSGWTLSPEIDWTNDNYGDTRIAGTSIIFPTGTIDPWHILGVTNTTVLPQPTEIPLLIVGTSHCADLSAPSPYDLPSLTAARVQISAFVNSTLAPTAIEETSSSNDTCDDQSSTVIGLAVAFGLTFAALLYVLSFGVPGGSFVVKDKSQPLMRSDDRMRV